MRQALADTLHKNITIVPEILTFSPLATRAGSAADLKSAEILLANGSTIGGFDYVSDYLRLEPSDDPFKAAFSNPVGLLQIILGTGSRYSFPFLQGLHNR